MKGFQLTFLTLQSRKHPNGEHLSHWLIGFAKKLGIQGVTVIKASQGVGRDGTIHSDTFFELADEPLEVVMNVSEELCESLFKALSQEKLELFYTKTPIEFGTI